MNKCRVVVFGSYYRGFYLLNELLHGDISEYVSVTGVATDDPTASFISANKRVWQYPHTLCEERMVAELAQKNGIEVYFGKVNDPVFHELAETRWRPDICVMGTFGQRIRQRLIDTPALGFYNLHPCIDDPWPTQYAGGNPFNALLNDKKAYTCIAFHAIDEGFDTGPLIARSGKIAFPPETSVTDMHKITAYAAAQLACQELKKIILCNRA